LGSDFRWFPVASHQLWRDRTGGTPRFDRLLKDDEERRKKQLNATCTFSWDKPLHENAGQIGLSFEQIGAVTILEAFDWRSNILICCRNPRCD
jgi:hypothetical protein